MLKEEIQDTETQTVSFQEANILLQRLVAYFLAKIPAKTKTKLLSARCRREEEDEGTLLSDQHNKKKGM